MTEHRRSPAEKRFDELKARTTTAITNQTETELPDTHRPAERYRRTADNETSYRTVCICGWESTWEHTNANANWLHLMHRLQQLAADK